jgi:hypothetical protein
MLNRALSFFVEYVFNTEASGALSLSHRCFVGQRKLTGLYRHTLFPYLHRLFELALPDCFVIHHACCFLIYGPSNIIMLHIASSVPLANQEKSVYTVNLDYNEGVQVRKGMGRI